jgi:4-aminobutyrate aminotransferase-like enzyme
MLGMEFVRDRDSKLPIDADLFADIFERTKDYGVLASKAGRFGNILRFLPPLCVTEEDIDFTLDVVELSIKEAYEN